MRLTHYFPPCVLVVVISVNLAGSPSSTVETCADVYYSATTPPSSGEYTLTNANGESFTVYCLFRSGYGYTFISPSITVDPNLATLFTKKSEVLIRHKRTDRSQYEATARQISRYSNKLLGMLYNSSSGYNPIVNSDMTPYLYLGFVPKAGISHLNDIQGWKVQGTDYTFINCDGNSNSYFSLLFNQQNYTYVEYSNETNGIVSAWYDQATMATDILPESFLTSQFEIHFGGCGGYQTSKSYSDVEGVSFGFKFNYVICYPNNTIHVMGLSANHSYFAIQDANPGPDVPCVVTSTSETSVKISNCTKNLDILLTYNTYDDQMVANGVHGGKNFTSMKIKCDEIPSSGIVHTINNTFAASLTFDQEAALSPTYTVSSSLSTNYTTVGSEVTWTIFYPAEYILEVTECTAHAGTNDTSTRNLALISSGGCTIVDNVVSQFTDNLNGTATATILAFKFFDEENVFLTCYLIICPPSSMTCNTTCSRTKRDVNARIAREAAGDIYLTGSTDYHTTEVHDVLHVILSGSMRLSPFNMSMIFTFVLIFLVTQH